MSAISAGTEEAGYDDAVVYAAVVAGVAVEGTLRTDFGGSGMPFSTYGVTTVSSVAVTVGGALASLGWLCIHLMMRLPFSSVVPTSLAPAWSRLSRWRRR